VLVIQYAHLDGGECASNLGASQGRVECTEEMDQTVNSASSSRFPPCE